AGWEVLGCAVTDAPSAGKTSNEPAASRPATSACRNILARDYKTWADCVARVAGVARFRYVVCDVFTDAPLTGNQLAVFTDARDLPEERLQELAREMNFSETVFVYPSEAGHARIRIFTPG